MLIENNNSLNQLRGETQAVILYLQFIEMKNVCKGKRENAFCEQFVVRPRREGHYQTAYTSQWPQYTLHYKYKINYITNTQDRLHQKYKIKYKERNILSYLFVLYNQFSRGGCLQISNFSDSHEFNALLILNFNKLHQLLSLEVSQFSRCQV